MQKYNGKGVYGAIAIGKIARFKRQDAQIRRNHITDVRSELARVDEAKEKAMEQLTQIYEKALKEVGETNAQIFEIHRMMIEDDDYNESIRNIIESQRVNAEYAVAVTADHFAKMFSAMEDAYMQARASDVKDISNRIIACMGQIESAEENGKLTGESQRLADGNQKLTGESQRLSDDNQKLTGESQCLADGNQKLTDENRNLSDKQEDEKVIICAEDLAPSETVSLDKEKVLAFVTAHGSSNSHTAILARNMNIPAVIGVGDTFLEQIQDGDVATVDGFTGEIVVNPDEDTLKNMTEKQEKDLKKKELLKTLKGKENITLDGTKINIYANIGGVEHVGAVLVNDADGIGLFRSEFLYLENSDYPTEQQQFEAYKQVIESMGGKKVIIRTLDIGADKQVGYFNLDKEENPALGLRAIRICLTRPEIFKTQLRALLRASAYGNLGIMFPMIASVQELEQVLAICDEVKEELKQNQMEYNEHMEIGIMIETPAAALISEKLAPMVDFFSVGTNDLIQYTLACDRQNPKLEQFCDTHHEAVLKLIEISANNAHKTGKWIGICGELAADTSLTKEFLRMGIDELSVSPTYVLPLRDAVRKTDLRF